MLGNFSYCNPTKLYFGEDSLDCLREELPKYGKMSCWSTAVAPSNETVSTTRW